MESSSLKGARSAVGRTIRILLIAAVAICVLWTGGWFLAAKLLKDRLPLLTTTAAEQGKPQVDCKNMQLDGFPFKIALSCADLDVDDHDHGIAVSLGAIRSGMHLFSPSRVETHFEGPAVVRDRSGVSFASDWDSLRSELQLGLDGLETVSFHATGSKSSFTPFANGAIFEAQAGKGDLSLGRKGEDLGLAATFEDIQVTEKGAQPLLPPLRATVQVSLAGKAAYMKGWPMEDDGRAALRGASGTLETLTADLGEGRILRISGPFSFSEAGLLSGDFTLTLENPDGWGNSLRQAFPPMDKMIGNAVSMLKALGRTSGSNSVKLGVRDGVIALGFIPLGTVPPI